MVFSDTSTQQGIVQDIDFWITGRGDIASDCPLVDKVRNSNRALDRICSLFIKSDNKWNWDDNNYTTTLPIGTTDLVSGQRDYGITGLTFLTIQKILVKDQSGNYQEIKPVLLNSPEGQNIAKSDSTDTGTPLYYLKVGSSFILGPEPDYDSTKGIKVFYQRNIQYFTTSDTTAEPGFAPSFHRLVSLYAARDYCAANGLTSRLQILDNEINKMEAGLVEFYSMRTEDKQDRITLRNEDYGASSGMTTGEPSLDWN